MKGYRKYAAIVTVDQLREYKGEIIYKTDSISSVDSTD